jgi:hypothetical protein
MGRLAGDAADVMLVACAGAAPDLTLDLSEVYYADEAGLRVLETLRARGALLHRPRPYLALLLGPPRQPGSAGGPDVPAEPSTHPKIATARM